MCRNAQKCVTLSWSFRIQQLDIGYKRNKQPESSQRNNTGRKHTKMVTGLCLGVRSSDDFPSTFLNFPSFLWWSHITFIMEKEVKVYKQTTKKVKEWCLSIREKTRSFSEALNTALKAAQANVPSSFLSLSRHKCLLTRERSEWTISPSP